MAERAVPIRYALTGGDVTLRLAPPDRDDRAGCLVYAAIMEVVAAHHPDANVRRQVTAILADIVDAVDRLGTAVGISGEDLWPRP